MSRDFERLRQEPGLADLLLPVRSEFDTTYQDLRAAKAAFELARKTLERAEAAHSLASMKLDQVMRFAERFGYSRENLERFCDHELQSARKAETDAPKKQTLSNTNLMLTVAGIIEEAGEPLTLAEILEQLDRRGVHLPGKAPERNLTAYLSRSPLITSVRRGWYDFDEELLNATKRRMQGDRGEAQLE